MKRKITKIGTLLASVALLFGATSWASAQEKDVTITFSANAEFTGFVDATIEGDNAEKAKIDTAFWSASRDTMFVAKKVTNKDGLAKLGEGTDPNFVGIRPAEKGDKDASAVTFTVLAANGYAFVLDEVYFEAMKFGTGETKAVRYRAIHDGKNYTDSKEIDVLRDNAGSGSQWQFTYSATELSVSESTPAVKFQFLLGAGTGLANNKEIGIRNIKIKGHFVAHDRIHVGYIADAADADGVDIHPVLTALQQDTWNFNAELLVLPATKTSGKYSQDDTLKVSDYVGKYDVVAYGGGAGGDSYQAISFFQKIVGKVPTLNVTKAFSYGGGSNADGTPKRSGWSSNSSSGINNSSSGPANDYIVVEPKFRTHPIYTGLDADTIVVFPKTKPDGSAVSYDKYKCMQGYPEPLTDAAPEHTLLGTSGKADATTVINSVAEGWREGEEPYMMIAFDHGFVTRNAGIQLTKEGAQLYRNAVIYLDSAQTRYIPPIIDELKNVITPEVTFAKVKETGTESDTLRYVVNISKEKGDSVYTDMAQKEKTLPTVMIALGDGAAKAYDYAKPDTIWQDSLKVKLSFSAKYYDGEVVIDTVFTNAGLRPLPDPEPVYTPLEDKRHVLTFNIAEVSLDGKDTIPTIKYSLDGSDNLALTYDANKPDTLKLDATVKAQAQLYLYLPSNLVSQDWRNPLVEQVKKPEITFVPDPAYPDGCVQLVTITTATEGATIYYTPDGQEANEHSWLYQGPFPITNFDAVALQAIAMKDMMVASDRAYDTIPASTSEPLAVPTITLSADGNSFEIASTDNRGAIYYTMDGTEPSETNGLKYTGKVTYCGTDTTYLLVAKGQGYGYRASAVSDTAKFTPKAEVPVMGKPLYVSTFGKDDPNNVPGSGDVLEKGWFRYNTKTGDTYNMPAAFLTEEEEAEGISWDQDKNDQTKDPRIHIFINTKSNEGHDWRHYNDWVFYRDPAAPRDGQKGFRIMLHSGYNPGDTTYETTKGAFHFFHKSETTPARLSAGPVAKYKGPFAVRVVVAGGEKLDGNSTSAAIKVCVSDSSEVLNEIVLGRISNKPHESACDTFYYYGDNEVNIRLVSDEQIDGGAVFDFAVLGAGAALPPLAIESIDPATGTTEETAAEIAETVNVFKVTFNNDITINDPSGNVAIGWTEPGVEGTAWCDAVVEEGNVLVITLPEDAPKVGGAVYELSIDADNVIDGDKQRNEGVKYYYKVKAAASIDEVSAAKEVVATHIYSISGAEIPALKQGVNIVKTIYSDGTMTFEKVQVK